jgi:hypothetical protein
MVDKSRMRIRALRKVMPCVYLLIKDNHIVYVGQTLFPDERISKHRYEKRKNFDRYKVIKCDINLLNFFEERLVDRFKPCYNTGPYVPYCQLSRFLELRREIKIVEEYINEYES